MEGGMLHINWHDTKPVLTLDFHPFSGLLATVGADFDIKMWLIGASKEGEKKVPTATYQNSLLYRCNVSFEENGKPGVQSLTSNQETLPRFFIPYDSERYRMKKDESKLLVFSGTVNPALSKEIACYMGLDLGDIEIKRFADDEIYVQLCESVRGCDVFLMQPTCPPANENLMELLVMIDSCRRASAKTITAVIPYFGYAKSDRKNQGQESISAKLVDNLITEVGADRVLACDLHSGQSIGYFDIPVNHIHGQPVILDYLASKTICVEDLVVVSPDVGGVAKARAFAKKLSNALLAIVDKWHHGHNVAEALTNSHPLQNLSTPLMFCQEKICQGKICLFSSFQCY